MILLDHALTSCVMWRMMVCMDAQVGPVKMSSGLKAWLEQDAEASGRTVAASVRWYLERARQSKDFTRNAAHPEGQDEAVTS